jgi:hypothetical protein
MKLWEELVEKVGIRNRYDWGEERLLRMNRRDLSKAE